MMYRHSDRYKEYKYKLEDGRSIHHHLKTEIVRSKNSRNCHNLNWILYHCCESLNNRDIDLLISNGACPSYIVEGENCFHKLTKAAGRTRKNEEGEREKYMRKMEYLLKNCEEPHPLNIHNSGGLNCLYMAVKMDTERDTTTLIQKLAVLINTKDNGGVNNSNLNITVNNNSETNLLSLCVKKRTFRSVLELNIDVNRNFNIQQMFNNKKIHASTIIDILHLIVDRGLDTSIPITISDYYCEENFMLFLLTVGFHLTGYFNYDTNNYYTNKFINCTTSFPNAVTLRTLCIRVVKRHQIDTKFQRSCPLLFEWPNEIEEYLTYMKYRSRYRK